MRSRRPERGRFEVRLGEPVRSPHDHGCPADETFRDPALVVLVEPGCDPVGRAELALIHTRSPAARPGRRPRSRGPRTSRGSPRSPGRTARRPRRSGHGSASQGCMSRTPITRSSSPTKAIESGMRVSFIQNVVSTGSSNTKAIPSSAGMLPRPSALDAALRFVGDVDIQERVGPFERHGRRRAIRGESAQLHATRPASSNRDGEGLHLSMVPRVATSPLLSSAPVAGVAQSAERLHGKEEVRGSIPLSGSPLRADPSPANPRAATPPRRGGNRARRPGFSRHDRGGPRDRRSGGHRPRVHARARVRELIRGRW